MRENRFIGIDLKPYYQYHYKKKQHHEPYYLSECTIEKIKPELIAAMSPSKFL